MRNDPLTIRLKKDSEWQEPSPPIRPSHLPPPSTPRRARRSWQGPILAGIALLALLCVGYLIYRVFFLDAEEREARESQELVDTVGMLMLLPADEQPTIATVTDLESLRDQEFFRYAELGDIVLMYPKAQRAILYNPDENKIIEVAPITIDVQ
ncbi:MAG: hypothetical protein WA021_03685 [Minisyncoccia bacterium]